MDEAISSNVADLLYLKGLAMLFDTHAIEHLRNSGTRKVLRHSRHWSTFTLGQSKDTWTVRHSRRYCIWHTRGTLFNRLFFLGRLVMLLDFKHLKHLLGTGCVLPMYHQLILDHLQTGQMYYRWVYQNE